MTERCIRAWVSGRVQGVSYRASAREKAFELDIGGYARNLRDGRVEVLACGDDDALELFIEWLHDGPDAAEVTDVDVQQVTEAPLGRFTVR